MNHPRTTILKCKRNMHQVTHRPSHCMSYGNCCVVSDIAECSEVVEDKAVTFQKSNVQDLKEKLQRLCDDPATVQKYKNEAADFICSKYNWDEITQKTLEVYEDRYENLND